MSDTSAVRSGTTFMAVSAAFLITMMGTTLPTSIYPAYQQAYGFSALTITLIFAAYAVGVIGALLGMGSWSDQLGRRRMLLSGVVASMAAAPVFLCSNGLPTLLLGRLLSGISAGIFTATGTVAVIELAPPRWQKQATLLATAANMLGLGLGPLVSGVLVQWLPWPMRLPYALHAGLLVLAAWAIWRAPETAKLPARARLRWQGMRVPSEVRAVFVPAATAGFAGFVMTGFFTAVASQLIGKVLGFPQPVVTGLIVCLLMVCSIVGQAIQQFIPARWRQLGGSGVLVLGLLLMAACVPLASMSLMLWGTMVAGLGQGISFRAGLGEITAKAPAPHKAGVTAAFFVVLYIAISLPVIGVGLLDTWLGIRVASMGFAIVAAAIGLLAIVLLWRGRPREAR